MSLSPKGAAERRQTRGLDLDNPFFSASDSWEMTKQPITTPLLSCAADPRCLGKRSVDSATRRIGAHEPWFASFGWRLCALGVVLASLSSSGSAEESPVPVVVPAPRVEQTNLLEALQLLAQIQEQLRFNRLVIEQNALEARGAAARNAETLTKGLQAMESAFSAQQEAFVARTARELKAVENSNQAMLIVSGTCAAVAALAMLIIAYFQRRMSRALAGLSVLSPLSLGLTPGSSPHALAAGDPDLISTGSAEDSNRRLLGAMERLARGIESLENGSKPVFQSEGALPSWEGNGEPPVADVTSRGAEGSTQTVSNGRSRIPALLAQGQSLFKENELEGAIKCFDELLAIEPNHSEALVRKGAALERSKKLNEAFECYDRAIAADASMTIAYLHKGGLCNRLERFKEALECYEKALQTHDGRRG
jgi:tetratricopeptide (TPR) repeat protein